MTFSLTGPELAYAIATFGAIVAVLVAVICYENHRENKKRLK